MNTFVTTLKIASTVLFIFLLVPTGKIFIPMYLILCAGFVFPDNIGMVAFSLLVLGALLLTAVFSFRNTESHDRICLFVLLLLYVPVAGTISGVLESKSPELLLSYLVFISVSLAAIILTGIRLVQNQYTDQGSISKPFRKWVSRALMKAEPRE